MLVYWRKNEKDELVARKKAEKEALDRAKAEEEARESKRQSRKLNFLLTQTELYSHFIGKKIKTSEAEGLDADLVDGSVAKEGKVPRGAEHELGIGEDGEVLPDIDFDEGMFPFSFPPVELARDLPIFTWTVTYGGFLACSDIDTAS